MYKMSQNFQKLAFFNEHVQNQNFGPELLNFKIRSGWNSGPDQKKGISVRKLICECFTSEFDCTDYSIWLFTLLSEKSIFLSNCCGNYNLTFVLKKNKHQQEMINFRKK